MSRSLITMFLIFGLIFGTNLGFPELINSKFRFLTKCISIIISLCNVTLLIYAPYDSVLNSPEVVGLDEFVEIMEKAWFWITCLHLVSCVLVLTCSKYNLYNYLTDLDKIDKNHKLLDDESVGLYSLLYVFGVFAIKIYLYLYDCIGANYARCDTYYLFTFVVYYTPLLGLDAILLEIFLIYYYLYRSVKNLKNCLKNSEICVETVRDRYMAIADCFDKIRPHFDKMMLIEVVFDLPKLLGLLWATLVFIKENVPYVYYMGDFMHAGHVLLQLLLPTLAADLVSSQVEHIKLILHDELLRERDEDGMTLSLLGYLAARPLSHRLCRVVPVNLRLLFSLLTLCAGYFILVIQFTHLYD